MAYIADAYGPPVAQQAPLPPKAPPSPVRYASIDALKGLAILALWLVNNLTLGKDTPPQLVPAPWGRVNFADLIFPALLFGVGAGISIAARYASRINESFRRYIWRALKRGFWVIVGGPLVASAIAKRPVMEMGAIQMLGLAYFLTALVGRTPAWLRSFLAAALLIGYMAWIRLSPVAGGDMGTFTEKANIVKQFNEVVLAPLGLRGLGAFIPILSVVMTGSIAGSLYEQDEFSGVGRGFMFLAGGLVIAALGWLWTLDMPITAAYWSSSYTLIAIGAAAIVLGILSVLFDRHNGRRIAYPLIIPAASVLLALVGPPLLRVMVLEVWRMPGQNNALLEKGLQQLLVNQFASPLGLWLYTVGIMLVWWIVQAFVYSRRGLGKIDPV